MKEQLSRSNVVYCRLNHVKTAEEAISALSAQVADCLLYVQRNNLDQPLCILADIGRSTLDNDLRRLRTLRPVSAFGLLVDEIEHGRVANLICSSVNRLARPAANMIRIMNICTENCVRVHVASQPAFPEVLASLDSELLGRAIQE